MAVSKQHKALVKKLKKQVRILQRKEEKTRNQLRSAMKKMRKLGRSYKSKLAGKMKVMQGKIAEAQADTYAKVSADLERQILKGIESKGRALSSAIAKLEKKSATKLKKSIAKKGKKSGKVKKVGKTKKHSTRKKGRGRKHK